MQNNNKLNTISFIGKTKKVRAPADKAATLTIRLHRNVIKYKEGVYMCLILICLINGNSYEKYIQDVLISLNFPSFVITRFCL